MAIDREKVLQAAQGYIQKKRYDKAVAEYQKLIQQDPDDARTLLKIGDLQSKMEAYAESVATYERVGKHYAKQGFALKAIAVYKQIREIIHKHVPHLEDRYGHIVPKLAELYTQLGLISDALATYDDVATRMQRAGRDRDAIEVFKKIVELDPTNPLPHLRLAEALSRVKDVEGAIAQFAMAAEILVKLNRRDDALKVFERLLHHRADVRFARQAAEMYLARGQANDGMLALAKLQVCFQADPKDLDTLALLARAFVAIGQAAKAVEVQKEMGRIARDAGKVEMLAQIVAELQRLAPNDEGVKKLASQHRTMAGHAAASEAPPPMRQESAVSYADAEIEELEEEAQAEAPPGSEEQPFPMRTSVRSPAHTDDAPELEVVEEAAPSSYDEAELLRQERQAVADAESFRKLRLYAKAVDALQTGLEASPRSVAVREKLRDILLEVNETERAIEEMFSLAAIALDALDADGAVSNLLAILQIQPDHDRALEMLGELGYEVAPQAPAADTTDTFTDQAPVAETYEYAEADRLGYASEAPVVHAAADYDHSAPLPSYDLEEIGPTEAMSSPEILAAPVYAPPAEQPAALGDEEAPLPSFPMDDEEAQEFVLGEPAAAPAPLASAGRGFSGGDSIEDALEEAEFFTSRGLLDDARAILEEQLARAPNHPLLRERVRELDAAQAAGGSGTRERPQRAVVSEAPGSDRAFDIAASLDALDEAEAPAPEQRPAFASASEQVDVEEVFAKFKAGVKANVSEADSATHYDLGVAYQEMGLISDAIDEFEVAARDPKRACIAQSMIGMIQRNQGNVNAAVEAFIKGLHAENKTIDQELGLYYELGDAYEAKGNSDEALYYFQKVQRKNGGYADPRGMIADRIRALTPQAPRVAKAAVGATDDFDAAFDAILEGGMKKL